MSRKRPIAEVLPAMFKHAGVWEGVYQHVDLDGKLLDVHKSRVECLFPDDGPFAYIQRNQFSWDDGRSVEMEFGGVLRGDRIFWDTPTFSGYGWETRDNVVMLTLERKDVENASFTEIIVLGEGGNDRARTWHWFRAGKLIKRTLCNEHRVGKAC